MSVICHFTSRHFKNHVSSVNNRQQQLIKKKPAGLLQFRAPFGLTKDIRIKALKCVYSSWGTPQWTISGSPQSGLVWKRLQVSKILLYIRGEKPELFLKHLIISPWCGLLSSSTVQHRGRQSTLTHRAVCSHIRSVLSDLISALRCSSGLLTLWQGGRTCLCMCVCSIWVVSQYINQRRYKQQPANEAQWPWTWCLF